MFAAVGAQRASSHMPVSVLSSTGVSAKETQSTEASGAKAGKHHPAACDGALTRAFSFLGKRWNGVILATLQHGPLGYAELRRAVEGISDSVLSERLSELSAAGLALHDVEPGPPVTVRYRLTEDGQALMPVLGEPAGWASRHLPEARASGRGRG
ncbi:winged helix-turn-helix transcriptional regulator [Streptomyces sp. NPDC012403]|uniref:winged helix-turn-helix transcriptional regulator n=1 Tax=Streptomyces sp. NPDC012403 TaxID=3364831 RepID=UPI0036E2DDB8